MQRILDPDLAALDSNLQSLPTESDTEEVVGIQHKIPAVCTMQGSGLDHREIGDRNAHLDATIDRSEEVRVSRVLFDDDRRTFRGRIVDEDVDRVALQRIGLGHRKGEGGFLRTAAVAEIIEIVGDVLLNGVEEGDHAFEPLVVALQLSERGLDHEEHGLLRHLLHVGLALLLDACNLLEVVLKQRLDFGLPATDLVPLLLGKRGILLLTQRFPVLVQRKRVDPDGSALDGEPEFASLSLHLLKEGRSLLAETLVDPLAPRLEFVRLEQLGNLALEPLDVLLEIGPKAASHPGGKLDVVGTVGVLEIVDVAEVRGLWFIGARLAEEVLDGRHFSRAGASGDVDVVSVLDVLDAEPELERPDGALLADDPVKGLDFGGRREVEVVRIASVSEFLGVEFFDHVILLRL